MIWWFLLISILAFIVMAEDKGEIFTVIVFTAVCFVFGVLFAAIG